MSWNPGGICPSVEAAEAVLQYHPLIANETRIAQVHHLWQKEANLEILKIADKVFIDQGGYSLRRGTTTFAIINSSFSPLPMATGLSRR